MHKIYKLRDYHWREGETNTKLFHDVIVVYYNRFNKKCLVKTITSLEKYNKKTKEYEFKNDKLDAVRKGEIIVIPKTQINTDVLSGVYYEPIKVRFSQLEKSDSNYNYPKRYKKVIK